MSIGFESYSGANIKSNQADPVAVLLYPPIELIFIMELTNSPVCGA
jgi:hypothetical protein